MEGLLHEPARHVSLRALRWNEREVRAEIARIVADAEAHFTRDRYWPLHPLDRQSADDHRTFETSLYNGACGVFWAMHYLEAVGEVTLARSYATEWDRLLLVNRALLDESAEPQRASFLLGDTPILMMAFGGERTTERADALAALIGGNLEHRSRELMLGAPGTLLAALFLHERTGEQRWSDLFRLTADRLWRQLEWSPREQCAYWTQHLFGYRLTYLGAGHGFVATALPLIRGRHLLDTAAWNAWEECIVTTVQRTADRRGDHVNWRIDIDPTVDAHKKPLQFCHGAPGFVSCLASSPGAALDDLLLAAGETIWSAGPLAKGSNLCHGTAGNGYALLKLYERTRDTKWLERARAFALHGMAQAQEEALRHGQARYSLWTGDLGLAIYLWDCLRGEARFPTLDVFYAA